MNTSATRTSVGNEDFVLGWRATIERILVDALADSGYGSGVRKGPSLRLPKLSASTRGSTEA